LARRILLRIAEPIDPPSERSTSFVFAAVAVIAAIVWRQNAIVLYAAMCIAGLLVFVGIWFPRALRPLNVAWFSLALLLNKIVSPVVMLVMFAAVITPFGLAMQVISRKRRQPSATSYWIDRTAQSTSMSQQF
jgi:hypothetical protein